MASRGTSGSCLAPGPSPEQAHLWLKLVFLSSLQMGSARESWCGAAGVWHPENPVQTSDLPAVPQGPGLPTSIGKACPLPPSPRCCHPPFPARDGPRCPVGVLTAADRRPYCLLLGSTFPGVLLQHSQVLPVGNGICPHSGALILGEDAVSVSPMPPCPCARYRALIHSFGCCPASARAQARCRGHGSADFGV